MYRKILATNSMPNLLPLIALIKKAHRLKETEARLLRRASHNSPNNTRRCKGTKFKILNLTQTLNLLMTSDSRFKRGQFASRIVWGKKRFSIRCQKILPIKPGVGMESSRRISLIHSTIKIMYRRNQMIPRYLKARVAMGAQYRTQLPKAIKGKNLKPTSHSNSSKCPSSKKTNSNKIPNKCIRTRL